jgi:hypothetical protein
MNDQEDPAQDDQDGRETDSDLRFRNWGQMRRLEFIDTRLQWDGHVNRVDLKDFFSISAPQATLDFAKYNDMAPTNLAYNRSEKAYFASDHFEPALASPEAHRYLSQVLAVNTDVLPRDATFLGWIPKVGVVPRPSRNVDTTVLKACLRAMRQKTSLKTVYQSMSEEDPVPRHISPHALGFDGFRWHLRAYCHLKEQFRDFVFARMLSVEEGGPTTIRSRDDAAWQNKLTLVLVPHPDLGPGRRRAIELDYGMVDGRLMLSTREALLFYLIRQLRLETEAPRGGESQQIVLENRAELNRYLINQHRP